MKMRLVMRIVAGMLPIVAICTFVLSQAANIPAIEGVITDSAGKPVRGAMITARQGNAADTAFSQDDGRYKINLGPGTYHLDIRAWGFAAKNVTSTVAEITELNVTMTPGFRVEQMSSAEIEQLLPDNKDTRLIKAECIRCHALTNLAKGGGKSATAWQLFLPKMTDERHWDNPYSGGEFKGSGTPPIDYNDRLTALSNALETYFGPDSPYFSPDADLPKIDQINHPILTETALKAVVHEFDIPTHDVGAHSIMTDKDGNAWFSEIQSRGNKIGEFVWRTQSFKEYPLPLPELRPHTGVIGKDGLIWYPLTAHGIHAKLVSLEPETGKMVLTTFQEIQRFRTQRRSIRTETYGCREPGY